MQNLISSFDAHIDAAEAIADLDRGQIVEKLPMIKNLAKQHPAIVSEVGGTEKLLDILVNIDARLDGFITSASTEQKLEIQQDILEIFGNMIEASPDSAKSIFELSDDGKKLLNLLESDDMYIRADIFGVLLKLNKIFYKELEESLIQTPMAFMKLMETLQQATDFVRNECLNFLQTLLEHSPDLLGNIIIMQGFLEYLVNELLPYEEDPAMVKKLCEILGVLVQTSKGGKYLREADLVAPLVSVYSEHLVIGLNSIYEDAKRANFRQAEDGSEVTFLVYDRMARGFKTCEHVLDVIALFLSSENAEEDSVIPNTVATIRSGTFMQLMLETLYFCLRSNYVLALKAAQLLGQIGANLSFNASNSNFFGDETAGGSSSSTALPNSNRRNPANQRMVAENAQKLLFTSLISEFELEKSAYSKSKFFEEVNEDADDALQNLDAEEEERYFQNLEQFMVARACPCGGVLLHGLTYLLLLNLDSEYSSEGNVDDRNRGVDNAFQQENSNIIANSSKKSKKKLRPNLKNNVWVNVNFQVKNNSDDGNLSSNQLPFSMRSIEVSPAEHALFAEFRKILDNACCRLCEATPKLQEYLVSSFIVNQDDTDVFGGNNNDSSNPGGAQISEKLENDLYYVEEEDEYNDEEGIEFFDEIGLGGIADMGLNDQEKEEFEDNIDNAIDALFAGLDDDEEENAANQKKCNKLSDNPAEEKKRDELERRHKQRQERLKQERRRKAKSFSKRAFSGHCTWQPSGRQILLVLSESFPGGQARAGELIDAIQKKVQIANTTANDDLSPSSQNNQDALNTSYNNYGATMFLDEDDENDLMPERTEAEFRAERTWFALQVLQSCLWPDLRALAKMKKQNAELLDVRYAARKSFNASKNTNSPGDDYNDNDISNSNQIDSFSPNLDANSDTQDFAVSVPIQLSSNGKNVSLLDFMIAYFLAVTHDPEKFLKSVLNESNRFFDEKSAKRNVLTIFQALTEKKDAQGNIINAANNPAMSEWHALPNAATRNLKTVSDGIRKYSLLSSFLSCVELLVLWSSFSPAVRTVLRQHSTLLVLRTLDLLENLMVLHFDANIAGKSKEKKDKKSKKSKKRKESDDNFDNFTGLNYGTTTASHMHSTPAFNKTKEYLKLLLVCALISWVDLCPEILAACINLFEGKIERVHSELIPLFSNYLMAANSNTPSKTRFCELLLQLNIQKKLIAQYIRLSNNPNFLYGMSGNSAGDDANPQNRRASQGDNAHARRGERNSQNENLVGNITTAGNNAQTHFVLEEYKDLLKGQEQSMHVIRQENIRLKEEVYDLIQQRNRLQCREAVVIDQTMTDRNRKQFQLDEKKLAKQKVGNKEAGFLDIEELKEHISKDNRNNAKTRRTGSKKSRKDASAAILTENSSDILSLNYTTQYLLESSEENLALMRDEVQHLERENEYLKSTIRHKESLEKELLSARKERDELKAQIKSGGNSNAAASSSDFNDLLEILKKIESANPEVVAKICGPVGG